MLSKVLSKKLVQNAVFAVRLEGAVFGKHLYFLKMSVKNYQRIMNMVSNQIFRCRESMGR